MPPKVSICIPTFNRKDYLAETLESIYSQTYKDYEVLVVDDGSTDGTKEMLEERGYNLRYHWQENAGNAAARNTLLKMAQGKYVAFLDSDDLFTPDAIERMVKAMESEPEDVIVYGPYLRIDKNGKVTGRSKRELYNGYCAKEIFQTIFIHTYGSMFPRRALEEVGGFDASLPVCPDYDLWLRLSLKYRFVSLSEPTSRRRRHDSNISSRSFLTCTTKLKVLERFYFERGGQGKIPKRIAMRRLSKQAFRAGMATMSKGEYDTAGDFFQRSLRYRLNLKSLIYGALSALKKRSG